MRLIALATGLLCIAAGGASAADVQGLPDGRRYELVSPGNKQGADVAAIPTRVHAAAGDRGNWPMGVTFASLGGFADTVGSGVATEYLAERDGTAATNGWRTHAITPPQVPLTFFAVSNALDPSYHGDMTSDLTAGIFRAWSPLTGAPNVRDVPNLYRRSDLRTAGSGSYSLLTSSIAPLPAIRGGAERPNYAGGASDLTTVLFESRLNLTADAFGPNTKLYKARSGGVRLLAPSADCPGLAAAPCSAAGRGATGLRYTSQAVSGDGTRVVVTSPIDSGGGDNGEIGPNASRLYLFDDRGTAAHDDDTVTQVNASERTPADTPQAPSFQTASRDLSRIFFVSPEALTNEAPATGAHLYMYDTTRPLGERLSLLDVGRDLLPANATGVVGVSDDGRYVYFDETGDLVRGAPAGIDRGIYLWQDARGPPGGQVTFIGGLTGADEITNYSSTQWISGGQTSRVTPDGRTLLFSASDTANLRGTPDTGFCNGNPNGNGSQSRCSQLFVYSADANKLTCASCGPAGTVPTDSAWLELQAGGSATATTWHRSHALSDDGKRVFFTTASKLVAEDTNGAADAYEYDVATGELHVISKGSAPGDSYFMDASADGNDVFFVTRAQLVGWDIDRNADLYDARVGGGFPEPVAPPVACAGDVCQGSFEEPPTTATPSTATFAGKGNVRTRKRQAAKHKVKRSKRCRRAAHKSKAHGKRRCGKSKRARRAK